MKLFINLIKQSCVKGAFYLKCALIKFKDKKKGGGGHGGWRVGGLCCRATNWANQADTDSAP